MILNEIFEYYKDKIYLEIYNFLTKEICYNEYHKLIFIKTFLLNDVLKFSNNFEHNNDKSSDLIVVYKM